MTGLVERATGSGTMPASQGNDVERGRVRRAAKANGRRSIMVETLVEGQQWRVALPSPITLTRELIPPNAMRKLYPHGWGDASAIQAQSG